MARRASIRSRSCIEEIEAIFRDLGFTIATGPEAEHEWYNFGALNFPPDHPAMDMHDTLYLERGGLLRTHTSPVQIRTLQSYPPPIRIIAPGNVFRRDFFDASHAPMFAQIEGMAVDEGISFVDLKATLDELRESLLRRDEDALPSELLSVHGAERRDGCGVPHLQRRRLRDVQADGLGRDPRLRHDASGVLEAAGLDAQRYSGWAFGMGPARMALQRFGIPDIRIQYDSDIAFLEQFAQ